VSAQAKRFPEAVSSSKVKKYRFKGDNVLREILSPLSAGGILKGTEYSYIFYSLKPIL